MLMKLFTCVSVYVDVNQIDNLVHVLKSDITNEWCAEVEHVKRSERKVKSHQGVKKFTLVIR